HTRWPRDWSSDVCSSDLPGEPKHKSSPATDMHAGESETSVSMIARPDLVHLDRATQESGADQARLKLPDGVYTGIWWYARFPNRSEERRVGKEGRSRVGG